MCEDQQTSRHLLLGLDDADTNVLFPQLRSNILPSDTFLDGLSLENASKVKRACLIKITTDIINLYANPDDTPPVVREQK